MSKLTGDDHFILGIQEAPKDHVQGTGIPTVADNECAIWINTPPNINLVQQLVGDLRKVHRWIQSENLKDTAVAQVAAMPVGGGDGDIVASAPGVGEVGVYLGADVADGNKSHFLDRTFKRLIEKLLEAGKLN